MTCAVQCVLWWFFGLLSLLLAPVYVVFVLTLLKYRNEPYLNSAFFKICLSIGLADHLQILYQWLVVRVQFWDFVRLIYRDRLVVKLLTVFGGWFLLNSQVLAIILLAVNRFVAIVLPFEYSELWSPGRTVLAVAAQWFVALLLAAPSVDISAGWALGANSLPSVVVGNGSSDAALVYYTLGSLLLMLICACLVPMLYAILFYKLWHFAQVFTPSPTVDSDVLPFDRHECSLAAASLLISATLALVLGLSFLASLFPEPGYFYLAYCVALDVYVGAKPFVLLAASTAARKHFVQLLNGLGFLPRIKQPTIAPAGVLQQWQPPAVAQSLQPVRGGPANGAHNEAPMAAMPHHLFFRARSDTAEIRF